VSSIVGWIETKLASVIVSPAWPRHENFVWQVAFRFDQSAFLHDTLILFKRTFDPVHAIAVSIGHPSENLVGSRSRVPKKHVWNASYDFASVELVHPLFPIHKSPER
jgi:hypothetical protein